MQTDSSSPAPPAAGTAPHSAAPIGQVDDDGLLVAFATCELIAIDSQMALMINRENGNQQLIANSVLDAIKTCTHFETIDQHSRRICRDTANLKGQEQVVAKTLTQLHASGFLLEANQVCSRLNIVVEKRLPETRVFIITCDRPAAVDRLLDSMLATEGLKKYDALYLVDDSRHQENRAANAELVEKFNTRSAAEMQYFGEQAQTTLIENLIRKLPQHEQGIRFLLDSHSWQGSATYGRSRSLCLLLSVGYRAIVLDDDIECMAFKPTVPEPGLAVGSGGRREASFFYSQDSLMATAVPYGESPLDLHARYLGSALGTAIDQINAGPLDPMQLRGANAALSSVWRAESPILVTQCGSLGDPGTSNAHWTLNLSEHSISRLLTAEGGITHAIESRFAWLGAPRPTFVKMASMSQMTGLDNSALLPPYFPAFRGEDLLFAAMVEAMHPLGAVLDQDFAVPHLPENRKRQTLRDPIAGAGGIGLFASYLTETIDYTDGNDPSHRLTILAEDFRRLSLKSENDLLLDYRREIAKGHSIELHVLRRQLSATRDMNSKNWQGYLERGIAELESALQRAWGPIDLTADNRPEATNTYYVGLFKQYLVAFADALISWPEIRDSARQLTAQ